MIRHRAYRFKLRPNKWQEEQLQLFSVAIHWLYSQTLGKQKDVHEKTGRYASYLESTRWLAEWQSNPHLLWLTATSPYALQHALKDLDHALSVWDRKKILFPILQNNQLWRLSFRLPQTLDLDLINSKINLPCLGYMKFFNSRKPKASDEGTGKHISIDESAKDIIIMKKPDGWFMRVKIKEVVSDPSLASSAEDSIETEETIGIDIREANSLTLSDGTIFQSPYEAKEIRKLKKLQKATARKEPDSNGCKKATLKVEKQKERLHNIRNDWRHKTTSEVARKYRYVAMEDFSIKSRSVPVGDTIRTASNRVEQKVSFFYGSSTVELNDLRNKLKYKLKTNGGSLILVDPRNIESECPHCGHNSKGNHSTEGLFRCTNCGFEKNIEIDRAIKVHSKAKLLLMSELN